MSEPTTLKRARSGPAAWCGAFLLMAALAVAAPSVAAASPSAPLPAAFETTTQAWAVIPMGQLSDRDNTFWQLLGGHPGSSQWSVVTPPGVADNGGIVASGSAATIVVGFLPSNLLRFSPLTVSHDAGASWSPVYLPGALTPRPDALAVGPGPAGTLAIVGTNVLLASPTFSSWSRVASLASLAATSAGCRPGALEAVAFSAAGAPLVATSCTGGRVGVFTRAAGRWVQEATTLGARFRSARTNVITLSGDAGTTAALVTTQSRGRQDLVALWQSTGDEKWTSSAPLPLRAGASVRSTTVGGGGAVTALLSWRGTATAFQVVPGGRWTALPNPPSGSVAVTSSGPSSPGSPPIAADAFAVAGSELRVFALTPAATKWVIVQTTQVPLAYGSSG